jgi:hypothetical protein
MAREKIRTGRQPDFAFARAVSISINPQGRTFLGSGPTHPVGVGSNPDLEANILILHQEKSEPNLLVAIDTLFVGPGLKTFLERELSGLFTADRIVIAASHTHNAPMIDESKPRLGATSEKYKTFVGETIAREVGKLSRTEPIRVAITVRKYKTRLVSYRRKRTPYLVVSKLNLKILPTRLLPNLRKKVSPEAFVVEFLGASGIIAKIWIMPCHPVSFPDAGEVSANFVGGVRKAERARATESKNLPFLFLQGASGDLRPPAFRERPRSLLTALLSPGARLEYSDFTRASYEDWVKKLHSEFLSASELLPSTPKPGKSRFEFSRRRLPQQVFFSQPNSHGRQIDLNYIALGGLKIFALSGEPTHKAQKWLLKGTKDSTLIGCTGDSFGYLPSFSQLIAGGYEARGHREDFSIKPKWPSFFSLVRLLVAVRLGFKDLSD